MSHVHHVHWHEGAASNPPRLLHGASSVGRSLAVLESPHREGGRSNPNRSLRKRSRELPRSRNLGHASGSTCIRSEGGVGPEVARATQGRSVPTTRRLAEYGTPAREHAPLFPRCGGRSPPRRGQCLLLRGRREGASNRRLGSLAAPRVDPTMLGSNCWHRPKSAMFVLGLHGVWQSSQADSHSGLPPEEVPTSMSELMNHCRVGQAPLSLEESGLTVEAVKESAVSIYDCGRHVMEFPFASGLKCSIGAVVHSCNDP